MKKVKKIKTAHTPNSKIGHGDSYGSGIKNPVGRIREGFGMDATKPSNLKKPPRSLA